jgi:hypothetical protein
MIAYKLFKVRKDGSIGSLFINAAARLPIGEWMQAEDHKRKGYAHRPGWHATARPFAPHLMLDLASGEHRVWFTVDIEDYETIQRPDNQGGIWYLAKKLKILEETKIHLKK